jgi:hypothetical protein
MEVLWKPLSRSSIGPSSFSNGRGETAIVYSGVTATRLCSNARWGIAQRLSPFVIAGSPRTSASLTMRSRAVRMGRYDVFRTGLVEELDEYDRREQELEETR